MLLDVALIVLVFAFAGLALVGHVLVLSALMEPANGNPQAAREVAPTEKASSLRFPVTAG